MKKLIFTVLFAVMGVVSIYAKERKVVWEHPATEYANTYGDGFFAPAIDVTKVEMSDEETVVYLTAYQRNDYPDACFQFAKTTYLKAGGERYPIVSTDNFELGKWLQTGKDNRLDFVFHFPALPKDTKKFDILEGDSDYDFFIKGIKPKEERWNQLFPSYWRDDSTGDWVIGFDESCVIYQNKFWDYKEKPMVSGDKSSFVICDGISELPVTIGKNSKGRRVIQIGQKKMTLSMITERFLPDYPKKDTRTGFVDNSYKTDTITVVGWLKGLPSERKDKKTFDLNWNNIFTDSQETVTADLDELGRFTAKIPIINTTEFRCDWDLCFLRTLLEPGKTYFLLYDFNEGHRMWMGDDARLQNELFKFPLDWNETRPNNKVDYSSFIPSMDSLMNERHAYIANLCQEHPTLSERFARFRNGNILWRQARMLGQSRFYAPGYKFTDEARKYAYDKFFTKLPEPLTLFSYYGTFLRDYLDDISSNSTHSFQMNIFDHLDEYANNEEELSLLKQWEAAIKEIKATIEAVPDEDEEKKAKLANEWNSNNADMIKRIEAIINKGANSRIVRKYAMLSKMETTKHMLDSLNASEIVRDIYITTILSNEIEATSRSIAPEIIDSFKVTVKNPAAIEKIEQMNNHYLAIENREFDRLVLKSNDDVKGISEGEALLKKIVEPYKGKIVLLDIWGTWCEPCKNALSHSQEEYARLKDYDIEYLYLANQSSQESWENVIKEYDVTGDNVAHYNLPREQQNAIERYLDIHSFPTWKLIDRNGNVLDIKVDARDLNKLEELIKSLSDK